MLWLFYFIWLSDGPSVTVLATVDRRWLQIELRFESLRGEQGF